MATVMYRSTSNIFSTDQILLNVITSVQHRQRCMYKALQVTKTQTSNGVLLQICSLFANEPFSCGAIAVKKAGRQPQLQCCNASKLCACAIGE